MTDDIVTRLREQAKDWQADGYSLDKAADEIERLRRTMQLMAIDYRTQIAGLKMRCKCGACK